MGARAADDEIVLGATLPLTGPLAFTGQQTRWGLQLAQDDINAAGGIHGKRLRIAFEDTQASNSVAVNAFIKVVRQQNPAFVFLSSFTTQDLATEPEVAKAKVPVIYGGGAEAIAARGNRWMFRIRPDDSYLAAALSQAALTYFDHKPAGIMYVQDDYGMGAADTVETRLRRAGTPIVGKEAFGPRDNDFSAQLLSLKNKGAEVFIVVSYVRDTALILQQRRNLGITTDFVTGSGTSQPVTLDLMSAEDVSGVMAAADAVLGEPQGPASVEFVRRFEDRFGAKPDFFGSSYYDAAMIIAEGLRTVGPDREKLRDYLSSLKNFRGVTRTYDADERGNLAHSAAIISFIAGTKTVVLRDQVTN